MNVLANFFSFTSPPSSLTSCTTSLACSSASPANVGALVLRPVMVPVRDLRVDGEIWVLDDGWRRWDGRRGKTDEDEVECSGTV
jgi:hypothetical protein